MNVPSAAYRLSWLNLPVVMLVTLLQRTPAVRVLASASEYVLTSPVGQLLRGAVTAAALGALHSRAGATTFVQVPDNPVSATVGTSVQVAFTYIGTPSSPARFQIVGGSLPPGLRFDPAPVGTTILSGTPRIVGTPTQAGTFTVSVQGFNPEGLTNNVAQPIEFRVSSGVTTTPPAISAQPQSRTVNVGESVTFTVTATGDPFPSFQWRKNNTDVAGATSVSLTLTNVQLSDAGSYNVFVTNSAGALSSASATLTVNAPTAQTPVFTVHPISNTAQLGSTVVLNASATNAASYQWRRGEADIPGATGPTLVLNSISAAGAGTYRVVARAAGGETATSAAATLVVTNDTHFGRLINLSILTAIASPGESFTMGYVVGGAGTNGPKPLVIRAAGPSLGALNVPGTVNDPKIELFAGSAKVSENDNWGGSAALTAALAAVGAFPYVAPTSLDAATTTSIAVTNGSPNNNSVAVSANASGTGTVIAEIYDATPHGTETPATPRLVNVSVSKNIGERLTAGFVIDGHTGRTVLVRAIGPTLGDFGVPGVIADPQLVLNSTRTGPILNNDNWGGSASLSAVFQAVGAFGLPGNSRDAAVVITLPPGNYTVEVTGVANTTGVALIEVYEVP